VGISTFCHRYQPGEVLAPQLGDLFLVELLRLWRQGGWLGAQNFPDLPERGQIAIFCAEQQLALRPFEVFIADSLEGFKPLGG
jgi:hypothetical protein